MLIAYSYNPENMTYIGVTPCQLDPIKTNREKREIYLLPANATFVAPPVYDKEIETVIWHGTRWSVEEKNIPEPTKVIEEITSNNLEANIQFIINDV